VKAYFTEARIQYGVGGGVGGLGVGVGLIQSSISSKITGSRYSEEAKERTFKKIRD